MSESFDDQEALELDAENIRQVLDQTVPDSLLSGDSEAQQDLAQWLEELAQQFVATSEEEAQQINALLAASIALLRGQSYDEQALHPQDLLELEKWQLLASLPVPDAVIGAWQASDPALLAQLLEELPELEQIRSQAWLNQQLAALDAEQLAAWFTKKALLEAENVTKALKVTLQNDPTKREGLAQYFEQTAAQFTQDPFVDLAAYLQAVAALLRDQPVPAVPDLYLPHLAQARAVLDELK
jgi:hypothetical protein